MKLNGEVITYKDYLEKNEESLARGISRVGNISLLSAGNNVALSDDDSVLVVFNKSEEYTIVRLVEETMRGLIAVKNPDRLDGWKGWKSIGIKDE